MTRTGGKRAKIAVFCSGYGSNFQALIDAAQRGRLRADIALMVCDNPKARALARARKHGVPTVLLGPRLFSSREAWEKVIVRILKSQRVDLVVLAGFMRLLTGYFIGAYRGRILNIHPSYLPKHKGAHAIRDAFESGARRTGVTVHYVTLKVDSGPVVLQKRVKISRRDTLKSLERKIHALEHRIYPQAVQRVIDGARHSPYNL